MHYNNLMIESKNLQDLFTMEEKIINLLPQDDARKYRRIIHKNLVIEIYTFWENFVKELIFECYKKYKKVIVNTQFIKRYFKSIQDNSYIRKVFLGNITDEGFNITIESLCHSNNLNYDVLTDLYSKLCFDKNDFAIHLNENTSLSCTINDLKGNFVEPIFDETTKPPYNKIQNIKGYLQVLVASRNTVAHQYQVSEIFTLNQLQSIFNFIVALCEVIIEYCSSQILKKSAEMKENISKRVFPKLIIRSNSKERTAILWIRSYSKKIVPKNKALFCYDKNSGIYRKASIVQIKNKDQQDCTEILPYEDYSIEINTDSMIRQRHKAFNICILEDEIPEYTHSISI
ncbi:hypothetical protein COC52_24880 [Priestia megaterium]|uniref:MAE_28990/MAE_18760 family HEPN-like nuclease n=1 Tax=Priestia megaterium TaxID=1404 RepID=UPI000BFDD824|nr:HEPN domain-containing protein [Priestia megaterium]PGR23031.1 hypothetical protein COC52_24880 [Priestia megaterium]